MSGLRTLSLEHFNLTAASADYNMQTHVDELIDTFTGTQEDKERFIKEMKGFMGLFKRYLETKHTVIDWNRIKSPSDDLVVPYSTLSTAENTKNLANKLCVLKLNGGLGTTMGCVGPKSAIEVREGSTFLDLNVKQIKVSTEFVYTFQYT